MDAERYRRACQLFDQALTRPTGEREAFLKAACETDEDLYREVARMVEHDRRATGLLDRSPEHPNAREDIPSRPPREAELASGTPLGAYRIVRPLGQGGMGTVYLATRDDDVFDREVAIKIVRDLAADEATRQRFDRERQILARLEHPYIARLYDGGLTDDGQPYLVMERIDGLPITTYCDHYTLTVEARLALMRKVCIAVQFAHRNLVVHRDLKPSNILINADGDPKLLDFGIAKLLAADDTAAVRELTHDQRQVMTLSHASPEQVVCQPVTTATDVYGLGLILYEVLCGVAPFALDSRSTYELLKLICEQPPQPPSAVVKRLQAEQAASTQDVGERDAADHEAVASPSIAEIAASRKLTPDRLRARLSGDLDAIVAMALRKEPERRYESVADFETELGHHLDDRPVAARSTAIRYRLGKLLRRHRAAVLVGSTLATLLVGLAIAFVVTLLAQVERTLREKDKAEQLLAFLIDTFAVANPDAAVGETVTARELLDQGAQRATRELEDEPELRAMMLDAMGQIYYQIGLFGPAENLLQESLAYRATLDPNRDVAPTATSLAHLAAIQRDAGKLDEAESNFRRSIELKTAGGGTPLPESLEGLAYARRLQYDYDEAEALYRQTIQLRHDAGELREKASALTALGILLREKGAFDESRSVLQEAISLRRQVLGPRHPEFANSLMELANLEERLGAFAVAEPLMRQALQIAIDVHGDGHRKVIDQKNALALTLGHSGRDHEAAELLAECVEGLRKLAGTEHPDFATMSSNLGVMLTGLGQYEQAEARFREALEIRHRLFGEGHPYVGQTHLTWGRLERARGDLGAAEAHYRKADSVISRLPAGHRAIAYPKMSLASLLIDRGRAAEAETMLDGVRTELATSHAPGHWRIAMAEAHLGRAHAALGKLDTADDHLRSALRLLQAAEGGDPERQRHVLGWLVELAEQQGRPEQAEAYQRLLRALDAAVPVS